MTNPTPLRSAPCLLMVLGLASALMLAGCIGPIGWLGRAATGRPVDPKYAPENRPTLILTEQALDSEGPVLRDLNLSGVISSRIGSILKDRGAISQITDLQKLHDLQVQTGERYSSLSAVDIGRKVQAQQVLQVFVTKARVAGVLGTYTSWADLKVRLLDADTGKCLFPKPDGFAGADLRDREPPYLVHVEVEHKTSSDERQLSVATLQGELAERIARDTARLFHGYNLDDPDEEKK
jgi:hypothetical protein